MMAATRRERGSRRPRTRLKKPVRKKAVARKPPGKGLSRQSAIDVFAQLSPDQVRSFIELLQADVEEQSAVDLFDRFLELCALGDEGHGECAEVASALIVVLDQLRIDINGGSAQARDAEREFLERLDEALETNAIPGPDIMLIGKLLSDAGWTPPETLREALVAALPFEGAATLDIDANGRELLESLVEETGNDEFAFQAELSSLLAAMPHTLAAHFLSGVTGFSNATLDLALVGFALHREAAIAEAALTALAATKGRSVDSLLVERLVRIRPWLPKERHASLDAAVRALRPRATAPTKRHADDLRRASLSICDGVGAHNIVFASRNGKAHSAFAVLIKPVGLTEILAMRDIRKSEVDNVIAGLRMSAHAVDGNLEGAAAVLEVALGDNLQSGSPPPYELVLIAERLGLGDLTPKVLSTEKLVDAVIGDAPPWLVDEAAQIAAHQIIAESAFADTWFEAGEAIEQLLSPIRGAKRREAAMLKRYLPARRDYWARVFAVSAFVMSRSTEKRPSPYTLDLALLARDLLSTKPTENLPILQQIAERTVEAFQHNDGLR